MLCEATPPSKRTLGIEQYTFDDALSPAARSFGDGAGPFWSTQAEDKKIAAWTRAVILHQPLEYLETTFESVLAYVATVNLVFPSHNEVGYDYQSFYPRSPLQCPRGGGRATDAPGLLRGQRVQGQQGPAEFPARIRDRLTRARRACTAVLMLLTFFAPFLPRGRPRQLGLLFFLMAWIALITPAASHTWDARAAIPPIGPLGAAAALGLWQVGRLGQRYRHQEQPGHLVQCS